MTGIGRQRKSWKRQLTGALGLGAFMVASASACVPTKREVPIGSQPIEAKVSMVGLDARFANDANLLFEMSTCVSAFNGARNTDGSVSFKAPGLKKGIQCQIKVKHLQSTIPGITFTDEPQVLFWARSVTLTEDTAGALTGSALLQQTYKIETPEDPVKVFSITAPVKFPGDALPPAPLTARIDCTPSLAAPGSFKAGTGVEGEFQFAFEFGSETKFKCTNIWVGSAGNGFFMAGKYLPDGAALEVSAGAKVTLPKVDLALVGTVNPPAGAVHVSTKPGDCGPGKIFNSMTRVCE